MSQTPPPDELDTILRQYHAERHQGLNELAGRGTADEQLKAAIRAYCLEVGLRSLPEKQYCIVHDNKNVECHACIRLNIINTTIDQMEANLRKEWK